MIATETKSYDTREGIEHRIKTLKDFNDLVNERRETGHQRKESLNDFYILGRWLLNNHGELMEASNVVKTTKDFIAKESIPWIPDVLNREEFYKIIKDYDKYTKPNVFTEEELDSPSFKSYSPENKGRPYPTSASFSSSNLTRIPTEDDTCIVCGKKWTVENCHDFFKSNNGKGETFHANCYRIYNAQEYYEKFKTLLMGSGFLNIIINSVDNRYCPCLLCPPWFDVTTPYGKILIGWRKRVINIECKEERINFEKIFPKENVTKDENYIHAYGMEEAKRYLTILKEHLEK